MDETQRKILEHMLTLEPHHWRTAHQLGRSGLRRGFGPGIASLARHALVRFDPDINTTGRLVQKRQLDGTRAAEFRLTDEGRRVARERLSASEPGT